uniref:Uncharacterized protein n=1 Tax=Plectus sambesii TaxID=2011161 RepID=A0A914WIM7_9BILA
MEERRKQLMSEDEGCVVDDNRPLLDTAIESTTALRTTRYGVSNWPPLTRPKSVCHFYPEENTVTVDCLPAPMSFTTSPRTPRRYISRAESVITRRPQVATNGLFAPPPANTSPTAPRKPQKPETARDGSGPVFRACCVYVNPGNSPPVLRPRPRSIALSSASPGDWNEFHRLLHEDAAGLDSHDRLESKPGGRISRQQSCASSASHQTLTPTETRKFHVVKSTSSASSTVGSIFVSRRCPDDHTTLSRSTSSQSTDSATSSATNNTNNNRFKREKDWHESEGL